MYHLYDTETDDGPITMIAVLPPELALGRGLPSPAVVGTVPAGTTDLTSGAFTPNEEFSAFLGYVISKYGDADPILRDQARQQGTGWVYMVDLRVDESDGEIQTEDVLGAFRAADGEVVPGSYRANPKHVLLTGRGLPVIDTWVYEKLVEELLALD